MAVAGSAPALIETKLRSPRRRPGLVPRTALVERLGTAVGAHRLTLVSAAAGWGKTTLVADWLAATGVPAGWVALDPRDDDPARFWGYLSEALTRAGIAVDAQATGAMAGGAATREAGLTSLINAIAAAPGRAVLALDDYHAISSGEIHEAMAFLLERLPDALRVVMTSRTDPPVGLARLRARGDLAEIRSDDLRFSDEEAGALLGQATGGGLTGADVARLRARTEGWAAGLYLAGLSLRGRGDATGFIDDFAGDDRLVVDYLAAEVLDGQDAGRREFLLRTAVLERLTGPLCDAVAETTGSARVLQELERSNLFLVPLDSRREWYRYHHLFAELLRHELTLARPELLPALHRRAAAWLLRHGAIDEAIGHTARAGDLARAADLIAEHWTGWQRVGWTGTTQRWLGLLPEAQLRADPRLGLARTFIAINLGRPEEAREWLDAVEAAAAAPEAPGDRALIAGALAAGRSLQWLLLGDTLRAVDEGRRAVERVDPAHEWWRAVATLALGVALQEAEEVDEAYAVLEESVAAGLRSGCTSPALVALCHLAFQDVQRGDPAGGERRARESIALAESERHAEFPHASGAHAALAAALAARGDREAARAQAEHAVVLARRGRSPTEQSFALLVLGQVAVDQGDRGTARARLDEARALLRGSVTPALARAAAEIESALADDRPRSSSSGEELTGRELAVLRRLTGHGSAREIAADLYVSHNTVKTQIRSIYRKLGVASREEAVALARRRGLLARP